VDAGVSLNHVVVIRQPADTLRFPERSRHRRRHAPSDTGLLKIRFYQVLRDALDREAKMGACFAERLMDIASVVRPRLVDSEPGKKMRIELDPEIGP
jgi:hypothetical protein